MESLLIEIVTNLRAGATLDDAFLEKSIRAANKGRDRAEKPLSKKRLIAYFLKQRSERSALYERLALSESEERTLVSLLQMKPRRTSSGVATVTVITKPHTCGSDCLYCPNDIRMPKSYLHAEPACQRAERNFFDPYLQVASRLRALRGMGHPTDKVELIVLGGTWLDYPEAYRVWFITRLFDALNDGEAADAHTAALRHDYKMLGLTSDEDELASRVQDIQAQLDDGSINYNGAFDLVYAHDPAVEELSHKQQGSLEHLADVQRRNETAAHRVVGLVVETRPDTITAAGLRHLRLLGCTKIQMGVQTLDSAVARANRRTITADVVARAFGLTRLFGFKVHAHFMVNLLGSTCAEDKADYLRFMTEAPFQPDEVKIYPCALVAGTGLVRHYENGTWVPYDEKDLIDVLADDILATPAFTRVSRMIRDISAGDIVAGNKKTNLRQMVEAQVAQRGQAVREIRFREIIDRTIPTDELTLNTVEYETDVTREYFLQWVDEDDHIAGFLRLSLPQREAVEALGSLAPVTPDQAMIREVHVYGRAAHLSEGGLNAQHRGLGRTLIQEACTIARDAGFREINVISSVGTREYYRKQGFGDAELYQTKAL